MPKAEQQTKQNINKKKNSLKSLQIHINHSQHIIIPCCSSILSSDLFYQPAFANNLNQNKSDNGQFHLPIPIHPLSHVLPFTGSLFLLHDPVLLALLTNFYFAFAIIPINPAQPQVVFLHASILSFHHFLPFLTVILPFSSAFLPFFLFFSFFRK